MLTYDDCVGLSELTPEEITAIARHEHVPEIVALEMGWSLCATSKGQELIRRMILDDVERARERGDTRAATELQLVLHRFIEAHVDRPAPAAPSRHAAGAADAMGTGAPPTEPVHDDDVEYAMRALGVDTTTAPWVRERVDAYLTAMLRHFGLDRACVRDRFRSEMVAAEMRCATCVETTRCRRFLAGLAGSEAPSAFCPNAQLFAELRERNPRSCGTHAAG
jgi:hypothetical protein